MHNQSGKVLTIFVIIFTILLMTISAGALFYWQKEIERRQVAEEMLAKSQDAELALETQMKDVKKENFLLQEKNKEADDRINSLMDELELEEGLREEMKLEALELREELEKITKEKANLREQIAGDLVEAEKRIVQLEEELKSEREMRIGMEERLATFQSRNRALRDQVVNTDGVQGIMPEETSSQSVNAPDAFFHDRFDSERNIALESDLNRFDVNLDPIVVESEENPEFQRIDQIAMAMQATPEGRILSVDTETDFVIVNLGEKDGMNVGKVMSVYRGNDYLGDIRVTRVQPEMLAADLIPPFSSTTVRKNDQVTLKQ